ncbi:hypothetical protein M1N58_00355 [Dehalococcoidales bacterium]|nr:hypothetical protein [Dehalococcoidales bacterium]
MELARIFNGKKFMWDGKVYADEKEAKETGQKYKDGGFEVELIEEGNHYFRFSRRVVTKKEVLKWHV